MRVRMNVKLKTVPVSPRGSPGRQQGHQGTGTARLTLRHITVETLRGRVPCSAAPPAPQGCPRTTGAGGRSLWHPLPSPAGVLPSRHRHGGPERGWETVPEHIPAWWAGQAGGGVPSQPHTHPHSLSDPYTTLLVLQDAHTQQSLASVPCSKQTALERRRQGRPSSWPVGFLGPRRSGEMQPAGPVGAEPAQRARSVVGQGPQGPERPQGSGCVPRRLPPTARWKQAWETLQARLSPRSPRGPCCGAVLGGARPDCRTGHDGMRWGRTPQALPP